MAKNPWAYNVSPAQRQLEITQNETIIAQLEACKAAKLGKLIDEWVAQGYSEPFAEPSRLVFLSPEAATALGVDGDRLAALAEYMDMDIDATWVPPCLPKGGYKLGMAVDAELEAKFGRFIYQEAKWPKMRADAKRCLNTAKKALGV